MEKQNNTTATIINPVTIRSWIINYASEYQHQINFWIEFYNWLMRNKTYLPNTIYKIKEPLTKAAIVLSICQREDLKYNQRNILEYFQLDPEQFLENNRLDKVYNIILKYVREFGETQSFTVLYEDRKASFYKGLDNLSTIRQHFQKFDHVLVINNCFVVITPQVKMTYKLVLDNTGNSNKSIINNYEIPEINEIIEEISYGAFNKILDGINFKISNK